MKIKHTAEMANTQNRLENLKKEKEKKRPTGLMCEEFLIPLHRVTV